MESESWYSMHYFTAQILLSVYVSFAIIWDTMIHISSNAVAGKLSATITASLSALIQYCFLNCKYSVSCSLFSLKLLKDNYTYWLVSCLNYSDKTKSLKGFKLKMYLFQLLSIFSAIFVFALGSMLAAEWCCGSAKDYFFDKWFGLAGALIFPVVSLFTSLVYMPNSSYKLFFSI